MSVADGGFVMITGDPGTGKSVAMQLLNDRLSRLPDVIVGTIEQEAYRVVVVECSHRETGELG
ncbi:MAG: hypothetical protein RLZZ450_4001 [Pseudomonadota bacterium]